MKTRKTLALIASDIKNDYMNRICSGVSKQANKLGYDLIVITMAFNISNGTEIQRGEENIFSLINNNRIDGVILLLGNASNSDLINEIAERVKRLKIPVVAIESELDGIDGCFPDDSILFEMMTDHFIEHHKCSDIMCLTGTEGMAVSYSRLKGYKRSLAKHGIKIKKENIVFGDFWKEAALNLADEFIKRKRKLPQAIVCANDTMGITLCNALIDGGISVPRDVMISGYDCSNYAMDNAPSLTTIFPENDLLGAKSVIRLHYLITGEKVESMNLSGGSLILLGSCGCNEGLTYVVRQKANYSVYSDQYKTYYDNSGMLESLSKSRSLDHLKRKITHFTYLLTSINAYMLCLDRNWDNFDNDEENTYRSEGYPDKLEIQMTYKYDDYDFSPYEFDSKEIVPLKMNEINSEPSTYFLLPLHFMDRCFGYTVFNFGDMKMTSNSLFSAWNRDISLALEFLRVRTRLQAINQRLTLSSLRDTLTGILNRSGFKRNSEIIFKKAVDEHKKLLVIMADLDMLKHINDGYGHIEGDNAITVCANGLNTCCQNNEVCARIGGDEYAIVGCYDYTDEIIKGYLDYVNDYFERYNSSSGKQYKVGASVGYYCGYVEEGKTFEDYMEIADKRMYANKFERKKIRMD